MKHFLATILILFIISGFTSFIHGQNQAIADSLEKELLQFDKSRNDSAKMHLYFELAYYHTDARKCLSYSEQLISQAEKLNDPFWLYRGYLQKGNAYKLLGSLDQALEAYLASAKYAETLENQGFLGNVYTATADIYKTAKNHQNAIAYFNKAIGLFRKLNDSLSLSITLLNLGSEFLYAESLDSAKKYLHESLTIFEDKEYPIGIAYCHSMLGNLSHRRKHLEEAEKQINEAISILEDLNDSYSLAINKRFLAEIAYDKKNYHKASVLAESSLELAKSNSLMGQTRDAHEILAKTYLKLGDTKKAYTHLANFVAFKDSINNEESIRKMADLRTEFVLAKKQVEIEKAETELALFEKKKQVQQIIGVALISVVALLIILALVLYRSSKYLRKLTKLLQKRKEELQAQHHMLEEVNKTKDRFFSIISHDLRGPIGILNGSTLLIRQLLESKDYDELDALAENMENSVEKVLKLLDNLLNWAISQQGKYTCNPEELDINELILETMSFFEGMAQAKNINLVFDQASAKSTIIADHNCLSTILRNLISNAIKFTNQFGTVTVGVEKEANYCTLFIKDTGIGIPENKLKNLFRIETNKSTWGTEREKGLGIGLNLVYDFVKMNDGKINVHSIVGTGTTFEVVFPITQKTDSLPIS